MEFSVKKQKKSIVINITSLVDVLFILLIFVLVSTTFLEQPALQIELPQAKSAALERIEQIVITISDDGTIYFNEEVIEKGELMMLLQEQLRDDLPVVLKADKKVQYGLVIEVMDVLHQVGVKKLVALTSPPDKTAK